VAHSDGDAVESLSFIAENGGAIRSDRQCQEDQFIERNIMREKPEKRAAEFTGGSDDR
jgi:hypothetical protein